LIKNKLAKSLIILVVGLGAAILLSRFGVFDFILGWSVNARFLGAFIVGIFYTSVLTTGPATAGLAELMSVNSPVVVALLGAGGAVVGDALLLFLERGVEKDIPLPRFLSNPAFRILGPMIGFLIIASPLPDEIGLAMMGASRIKPRIFLPLSYAANFIGILGIGTLVKLLSI
jgi:hypothetical protein